MSPRPTKRKSASTPSQGHATSGALQRPRLFAGMRFLFIPTRHMQTMMNRVRELGGVVEGELSRNTTHVVAPSNAAEAAVSAKLGATPPHQHLQFVTPNYVTASILSGKLHEESAFRPSFVMQQPQQPAMAGSAERQNDGADQLEAGNSDESREPAAKRSKPGSEGPALAPTPPKAIQRSAAPAAQARAQWQAARSAGAGADATAVCAVQRRGADWVAVKGSKPCHTGGHTGIPWGACGVWDEPFDESAAKDTVDKLRRYWYQHPAAAAATPPGPSAATLPGPSATHTNGVCAHAACALRPFCILQRLEEVRAAYTQGRQHQFQLKALDRALAQLTAFPSPLTTDADVDRIGLGVKSAEKVKEILRKGHSSRVAAAAADERLQCFAEFLNIWGVGPSTAEHWYEAGCRTLDDVRSKAAAGGLRLSEQQRVGLRYISDFSQKIPRAEVAAAEAMVREATFEVAEAIGAMDAERTYVFATGSYRRGAPESNDIDILICLPPSLAPVPCGDFLHRVLTLLLARGLLLDEMGPSQRGAHHSDERASWMGVARVPGMSPHARRIDFKIYSPQCVACAVNYFANSEAFCRATRLWANTAVMDVARRCNPAATGFKISDKDVVPIARTGAKGSGRGPGHARQRGSWAESSHLVLGPPVPVANESELFELLGLAYVPVHMRKLK